MILMSFHEQHGKFKANISPSDCDSIPELNRKILDFVSSNLNKKVGNGECWDLAAGALNSAGAKWDGKYAFGKEVNYSKECVYPGDVMQFDGVKVQYEIEDRYYIETMDQHTAIIYKVEAKSDFVIAHQNTAFSGRKVGLSPLKLSDISKGWFKIFRPEK
jgi:hypothetical protein